MGRKKTLNIYDNVIPRGWTDPQNHESLTKSAPLVPGEYHELSFDLQPDAQVIATIKSSPKGSKSA